MKFSNITTAISSAFDTTVTTVASACTTVSDCVVEYSSAAYGWVCGESKTTGNAIVITAETIARITWEAIKRVAEICWWLITLPVNLVMTILFYIFMYAMGKFLERQMSEMEEEMRFLERQMSEMEEEMRFLDRQMNEMEEEMRFQNAKPIIDMA